MKKFFIVCPLGFEKSVEAEMRAAWPALLAKNGQPHGLEFPALTVLKGGIEFETDEFVALQFNFFLKTASRILLRLAEFKARDFPKLHERIRRVPWQEYFRSSHVELKTAAARSRLNNEKRLEETLRKTLAEILPVGGAGGDPEGAIYLRMDDDLCTLSLDTTGEHLHKRGWGALKGEAPLRETIAHFILRSLTRGVSPAHLAEVELFDPMMGSGTFLTEARAWNFPQFSRPFAFQKWKSTPKLFLSPQFPLNYKLTADRGPFRSYRGNDVDAEMVAVSEGNFRELEKQMNAVQKSAFASADFQPMQGDVFELKPSEFSNPLWIVTNPPYGERLHASTRDGLADYAEALAALAPERMAFLYPEKSRLRKEKIPSGYSLTVELPILNGGLKTLLTILDRA